MLEALQRTEARSTWEISAYCWLSTNKPVITHTFNRNRVSYTSVTWWIQDRLLVLKLCILLLASISKSFFHFYSEARSLQTAVQINAENCKWNTFLAYPIMDQVKNLLLDQSNQSQFVFPINCHCSSRNKIILVIPFKSFSAFLVSPYYLVFLSH